MDKISLKRYLARQEQKRQQILDSFSLGKAAYDLAVLAMDHSSKSAKAAAILLLAMEFDEPFHFKFLLRFDTENRAKADLLIAGCQHHDLWPSHWMHKEGIDGLDVMRLVRKKWNSVLEESH